MSDYALAMIRRGSILALLVVFGWAASVASAAIEVRSRVVDLDPVGLIITGDNHSEVVTARNDGDVYAIGGRPG